MAMYWDQGLGVGDWVASELRIASESEGGRGCCSPDYRLQININDLYYKKWSKDMRNLILLFCCFLLFNCNKKNENSREETDDQMKSAGIEYHDFSHIKSNSFNEVIIEFIYNDENYKLIFHGKDMFIGLHISKNNNKVDRNIPALSLDFDKVEYDTYEANFIIDELNKSPVSIEMNKEKTNKINVINISCKLYIEDKIYKVISEVQDFNVSLVPTEELVNFLIELIDRYYLPLYTVQKSDTLSSICLKLYGNTNYEQIVKYNPGMKLSNQYLVVRPGEKIRIKIK
jgi:phage tail protein X